MPGEASKLEQVHTAKQPEPAKESEPVKEPEPAKEPEPVKDPEPVKESEPVKELKPAQESETSQEAEHEEGQPTRESSETSRKRRRSPSPVEPLSMPKPPRPTIRLQLVLTHNPTKDTDYIFQIPRLAVEQLEDQHSDWATWYKAMYLDQEAASSSREVGLSAQELRDLGGLAKLLQKYPANGPSSQLSRRRNATEYDVGSYDTKDPFVDDSELGVDEPTHTVRTSKDGFYVASGRVELAPARASTVIPPHATSAFRTGPTFNRGWAAGRTNKLLAKRAASLRQQQRPLPPKETSEAALPRPEPDEALPVAAPESVPRSAPDIYEKKRNKYPTRPVHPQLQDMFDHLKALVSKASFAVKTKFPPELKPPLVETAKVAVELDEYNDNFFNYLPSIFPYNRFTMMKLTKREFFHKHMEYFRELQEEHIEKLSKLIDEQFPVQASEYEALCREHGVEGKDNNDHQGVDEERVGDTSAQVVETDELVRRFRWSDEMREELFTIITVENAMSEIRNEKLKLENVPDSYSEINARKAMYKRIADLFPQEGWVNTTHVSREYGLIKKRRDREHDMEEGE